MSQMFSELSDEVICDIRRKTIGSAKKQKREAAVSPRLSNFALYCT